jgi:putative peptidoglycan binding protein
MAVTTYDQWKTDGRPWRLCRPAADLVSTLKRHGYKNIGTIGDENHLTAQPPQDHTPYSHTPWPDRVHPYPLVLAVDIGPGGDMDWRDLGAKLVADKLAGVPGTEPFKYINWTDRNGNEWQDSWTHGHTHIHFSDPGHIHISFRTDFANSSVMAGYDPVTGVAAPHPSPAQAPAPGAPPWQGREFRLQRPNMTGDDIRTWQQRMRDRGWSIDVDGIYGPQSESVCRRFQQDSTAHGWPLTVDGIVGPNTWRASWERPVS